MLRAFEKTWRTVRIEWEKSKFVAMIVASLEKLAGGEGGLMFRSLFPCIILRLKVLEKG